MHHIQHCSGAKAAPFYRTWIGKPLVESLQRTHEMRHRLKSSPI
ncbi:hypothetical protein [Syntrophobacter fumaroxidans]|nr:hypothetical protein [Syntrophobacter fumaroxidans]